MSDGDNVTTFPGGLAAKKREPGDPLKRSFLPLNDTGNGKRFAMLFGDVFRYVPELGCWFHFDGKRWKADTANSAALNAAKAVAAKINEEAAAAELVSEKAQVRAAARASGAADAEQQADMTAETRAGRLRRHALNSGDMRELKSMLGCAAAELEAKLSEFDPDPLAFNCRNGTLRFLRDPEGPTTVRLDKHDAADMITRITRCDYNPKARAALWEAHLARVQPDKIMRDYVHRVFGYCLTGLQVEQAFFVFRGPGGDGKSAAVDCVVHVAGDYAAVTQIENFLVGQRKSAEAPSPEMMRLAGDFRLVSTSEPDKGRQLNEGRLKAATGGAPMTARGLHKGVVEYAVRWKVVMEVNYLPEVQGADDGIWRRAYLVIWPVQIPEAERIRGFKDQMLAEESEGILAWAVRGVCEYLDNGLDPPEAAREASKRWRENSDALGEWINARVDLSDKQAIIEQKALWDDYRDFCELNGTTPRSDKWFSSELDNRGIVKLPHREAKSRRTLRRGALLRAEGGGQLSQPPAEHGDWGLPEGAIPF